MFLPLYDDNPLTHLPRPYVTYGLIALNVVVFFLTGGFDEYAVQSAAVGLGFIPSVVSNIEELPASYGALPPAATFVSYAFLHANWAHLLGNMAFLWVFGDNVEDALGHWRYLAFVLLSAVAAACAHFLADPASPLPLIGASGAVAAVVAAYLILHPRVKLWVLVLGRIPLKLPAVLVLGAWMAFQLFNLVMATPDDAVAWWAHLGGLAAGAVLVVVLRRPGVKLFGRGPLPSGPVATRPTRSSLD
jgi:membrane associated rhomboid family serine protease